MIKTTGLKNRKETKVIEITRTNTVPDETLTKHDLHKAELAKGNLGIAHHFIIRLDGTLEKGRDINKIGNDRQDAISVLIVGGLTTDKQKDTSYTEQQQKSLDRIIEFASKHYGVTEIV